MTAKRERTSHRMLVLLCTGLFLVPIPSLQAEPGQAAQQEQQPGLAEAAKPGQINEEPRDIQFDFRNAPLRTLIDFMATLSDLLVIVSGEVDLRNPVTISSPGLLTRTEAYRVVSAILDASELTMIRDDTFLRVVTKLDSVQRATDIYYGNTIEQVPLEDRVVTQVIPMMNSDARTILGNIQPLISPTGLAFVSPDTNMLVITETGTNIRRLMRLIAHLDVRRAAARTRETQVYSLRYMKAIDIAEALFRVFGAGSDPDGTLTSITPVESVNALIITSDIGTLDEISNTIIALDVRRPQVLIEVKIVEGTSDHQRRTGVNLLEWLFSSANTLQSITAGGQISDPFVTYTLDANKVDLVLTAAVTDNTIRILSAPRVLTSDSHEARIVVAQEEPIVKSITDLSSTSNVPRTVTDFIYRDVGIELTVTPRINLDRDVNLAGC